jgi:DNA-binding MarR family transcriptional regulator
MGCVRVATGSDTADAIIHAAHRIRTASDAALREHGLSLSGLKLLKALREGDRSMREISQVLHVSPRTVTDITDGMEARGLVARHPHPADRRVTLLRLTEAGAQELGDAAAEAERVAVSATAALDADEQRILRSLLERVCDPAATP